MPVTQWLDDRVPEISADGWSLPVRTSDTERSWSLEELEEKRVRITATLDCTGGWYAEQDWRGVPLRSLLPDGTGRSIVVRSSTGYARRFPIADLDRLFLATGVEDAPLSAGHGFPARIVAPGRRGFWWVKWVEEIEVEDRPWWAQLPFPAT
jgi:DMSO/TMAO reductase YedYZ molybdopterin-dependent catalytic subunit